MPENEEVLVRELYSIFDLAYLFDLFDPFSNYGWVVTMSVFLEKGGLLCSTMKLERLAGFSYGYWEFRFQSS